MADAPKRFIVHEFDESDGNYAGKFGVLHNDVCGNGMEAALMIDLYTKEIDAVEVCDALNQVYEKAIVGRSLVDVQQLDNEDDETVEAHLKTLESTPFNVVKHTIECSDSWMKLKEIPTYTELRQSLSNISLNARIIPDPAMEGATDVYAVPFEDIDHANQLLTNLINAENKG